MTAPGRLVRSSIARATPELYPLTNLRPHKSKLPQLQFTLNQDMFRPAEVIEQIVTLNTDALWTSFKAIVADRRALLVP